MFTGTYYLRLNLKKVGRQFYSNEQILKKRKLS